jgi:hypothetical protein
MSRTYPDREPAGLTTVALIGDCDLRKPSHRELNAVRAQLGTDVGTQWVATDSTRMPPRPDGVRQHGPTAG